MKSSYLPILTLAALLAAALATLVAGVGMARETRVVRTEVGREEIGDLSATVMEQLARLDRLYEDHLRRLASLELEDRFALRKACEGIVGVRQLAVAVDVASGGRSEPFQLNFEAGYRGVPMLPGQAEPALDGDFYYLPGDELAAEPDHGWLKTPGQPVMFWERRSAGVYIVVTPDPVAVQKAVNGWLEDWLPEVVEPVGVTGAKVRLAGALGDVWASDGSGATPPDVVVPMRARFGEWKISTWDDRVPVVSYHVPTLVISVGLAVVFALLGGVAFLILRRALRLGEQRVSFVNRVSHELRTPLTNILLNNDLAADAVELGDEVAAAGRLDLIREEAGRLSRLIANVLTFSRSGDESVPMAREVFSLGACVERTLAPFRASLVRRGIELRIEVDEDLRAFGDADLAAQVLANLISNVEKYAAGGGLLEISGSCPKGGRDAPATFLRIADRGPGIPESSRERVFQPFVRLSERVDEGVSGTGLGLAIARELAVKMGGSLRLEESEIGAVFLFSLPVAPENVVAIDRERVS